MPIYQYRCDSCQQTCELIRKWSDPPLLTCPNCQAEALRKLIAPVGVIFKGSGFHKNDYSSTGAHSTAKASTSGSDAKSTKSGDSGTSPALAASAGADSSTATVTKSEGSTSKSDSGSSSGDKPSGSSDKVA